MGKRTRRRKKSKNYIWLGVKGFFKLIWVGIKYVGLGFYYLGQGIGWCVHKLASKIRAPKFPEHDNTIPVETVDSSKASIKNSKTESKETAKRVTVEPQETVAPEDEPRSIYEPLSTVENTENFMPTINGVYERSQIALIFGKRGSGKSTLGFRIMENANALHNRECYVLGVKQDVLPSWIRSVKSIEDVKNGGIVLVDEGAITFSARQSMKKSNVGLGKLLAVARHKDLAVLFITQNTGMIDKNVLNLTDLIIAKEGSLLQKKMERKEVKDFVEKADKAIKVLPREERIKHTYFFSDDFEGLVNVPLPSFWSDKVSKNQN